MSMDQASLQMADAIAERVAKILSDNPPKLAPWVDQETAGIYIGKNGKYLEVLRAQNRGPAYCKVSSKMVRYKLQDVIEWMDARYERPGK